MFKWFVTALMGFWLVWAGSSQSQSLTAKMSEEKDAYNAALESYFGVTPAQIAVCLEQNLSDEDLAVALFIAQKAGVEPSSVLDVRGGGLTWTQVAWHYQLNPWLFYTPLDRKDVQHTTYEKPYSFYFSHSDKVKLTDGEVEELVGLEWITRRYACAPGEVIAYRNGGNGFRAINDFYSRKRSLPLWDVEIPGSAPAAVSTTGMGGHRHRRGIGTGTPPPTPGN